MRKNNQCFRGFSLLVLTMICFAGAVSGQNGQNMRIHFVAPRAVINNFAGHSNTTGIGLPAGYDIVQITSSNAAAFLAAAPPRLQYVYQQLQPGTQLRRRVNEVQNISRDSVHVNYYLVDDRTGISHTSSGNFLGVRVNRNDGTSDSLYHVWPSGNGFTLSNGTFQGRVRLGEYQLEEDQSHRDGGVLSIQEVVLHESFHTQLIDRWTKWPGYITYGADEMHYTDEILGDQETAFNEGAGTFYGFTINGPGLTTLDDFFTNANYRYFLEGQSVCAGYPELYTVSARRSRTVGTATWWDYRWRDVPGFFLMFNENNATNFFANFWRYGASNRDTAGAFLSYAFNSMWRDTLKRYLTYACNRLAIKMETYNASPAGQADANKLSSLFPFALLDLITHFQMTATEYQEDYRRNYPNQNPRAYTEYFTRRNAIKTLIQGDIAASPIQFSQALQRLVTYCKTPANIW